MSLVVAVHRDPAGGASLDASALDLEREQSARRVQHQEVDLSFPRRRIGVRRKQKALTMDHRPGVGQFRPEPVVSTPFSGGRGLRSETRGDHARHGFACVAGSGRSSASEAASRHGWLPRSQHGRQTGGPSSGPACTTAVVRPVSSWPELAGGDRRREALCGPDVDPVLGAERAGPRVDEQPAGEVRALPERAQAGQQAGVIAARRLHLDGQQLAPPPQNEVDLGSRLVRRPVADLLVEIPRLGVGAEGRQDPALEQRAALFGRVLPVGASWRARRRYRPSTASAAGAPAPALGLRRPAAGRPAACPRGCRDTPAPSCGRLRRRVRCRRR